MFEYQVLTAYDSMQAQITLNNYAAAGWRCITVTRDHGTFTIIMERRVGNG